MPRFFQKYFGAIVEINRKYQTPRLTLTPTVKLALLALRIYLLLLVGVMLYKFFTLLV